jgi:hypothetical protein
MVWNVRSGRGFSPSGQRIVINSGFREVPEVSTSGRTLNPENTFCFKRLQFHNKRS